LIVVEDEKRHPIDLLTLKEGGGSPPWPSSPKTCRQGGLATLPQLDDLEALDVDVAAASTRSSHSRTGKARSTRSGRSWSGSRSRATSCAIRASSRTSEAVDGGAPGLKAAAEVEDVKDGNGLNIGDWRSTRTMTGCWSVSRPTGGRQGCSWRSTTSTGGEMGAKPRIADQAMLLDLGEGSGA
jgi:hypothetical protein